MTTNIPVTHTEDPSKPFGVTEGTPVPCENGAIPTTKASDLTIDPETGLAIYPKNDGKRVQQPVTVPADAIRAALEVAGADKARPVLTKCAVWAVGPDAWLVAATDSYRLVILGNVHQDRNAIVDYLRDHPTPDYAIDPALVGDKHRYAITCKRVEDSTQDWFLIHDDRFPTTIEHYDTPMGGSFPTTYSLIPAIPEAMRGNPAMHWVGAGEDRAAMPLVSPFAFNARLLAGTYDVEKNLTRVYPPKRRPDVVWRLVRCESQAKPMLFTARIDHIHPTTQADYKVTALYLQMPVRVT